MRRLSLVQLGALSYLSDGSFTRTAALLYVGSGHERTLRSLEARALVRYFPHGAQGEGTWRITAAGRLALAIEPELEKRHPTRSPHEKVAAESSRRAPPNALRHHP